MRTRPPLIPNPCSTDEDCERYRHKDLGKLTSQELWAEETLVRSELARQIYFRINRPYGAYFQVDDGICYERDWLAERQRRLATELRRRGQR